jgi:hypothetical protein
MAKEAFINLLVTLAVLLLLQRGGVPAMVNDCAARSCSPCEFACLEEVMILGLNLQRQHA